MTADDILWKCHSRVGIRRKKEKKRPKLLVEEGVIEK
jgi:hypothetical protein